ncbi:MAG TPA: hypothetical protein VLE99_00945 [Candidatus Saccharimonadales bacterium]|nr:hypothetical protein [Candidatus Saccharimonadales bacterium]
MKLTTNWIAIVAASISALGAFAAWISNKRARKISASGQISSLLIELNRIFVGQPELRPYFIEGGKLPKGQEQKAKALASMYLNILEMIWSMEDTMNKPERLAWAKYIHHQIRSVPIVHNLYKRQEEWYPNLIRTMGKVEL